MVEDELQAVGPTSAHVSAQLSPNVPSVHPLGPLMFIKKRKRWMRIKMIEQQDMYIEDIK